MTEKEFHKLKRHELLQLLLGQVRETEKVKQELAEREEELTQLQRTCDKLKNRLDDKDRKLAKLKQRLDQKDAQLRDLRGIIERRRASRVIELEEAGNIAAAALKLSGIFEAAQRAADQYLYNLQLQAGQVEGDSVSAAQDDQRLHQLDQELAAEKAVHIPDADDETT